MQLSTSPQVNSLGGGGGGDNNDQPNTSHSNGSRNGGRTQQSPKITPVYTSGRRKSSLSYQQQLVIAAGVDGISNSGSCNSGFSNNNSIASCVSPSHYNTLSHDPYMQHHQHEKMSLHGMDHYDDAHTCCLPPPSPAPTSDRYIMCSASGGGNSQLPPNSHNHYINDATAVTVTAALCTQMQQQSPLPSGGQNVSSAASSAGKSNACTPHTQVVTGTSNSASLLQSSQKFSSPNTLTSHQRSLSPNSRFRLADMRGNASTADSSSRYSANAHFLSQHSPLVANDAYTYLSSTVHTPVKRYVPTPPPQTEIYRDMPMSQHQLSLLPSAGGVSKNSASQQSLPHSTQQQQQQQHQSHHSQPQHSTASLNNLPYRLRMKCCANETGKQQLLSTNMPLPHTSPSNQHIYYHEQRVSDYYTTSPRNRLSYKCNSNANTSTVVEKDPQQVLLFEQQLAPTKFCGSSSASSTQCSTSSSASSGASSASSPVTVGNAVAAVAACSRQTLALRSAATCVDIDYFARTPSIEFVSSSTAVNGSGNIQLTASARALASANIMSSNIDINAAASGGNVSTTCLHCNTMRRTTGVHQTTQTTGPISPVPLQQPHSNGIYSNSAHNIVELTSITSTPSTSESHISPLSPTTSVQQQQQQNILLQQQQHAEQDKVVEGNEFDYQKHQQNYAQKRNIAATQNIVNRQQQQLDGRSVLQQQQQQPAQQQVPPLYHEQQHAALQLSHPSVPLQHLQLQHRYSRKQRISQYVRKEISKFFGVDVQTEAEEHVKWYGRQRRLALRRFGMLKSTHALNGASIDSDIARHVNYNGEHDAGVEQSARRMHARNTRQTNSNNNHQQLQHHHTSERPDILPAQDAEHNDMLNGTRKRSSSRRRHYINADFQLGEHVERKASVPSMFMSCLKYIVQTLNKRNLRNRCQWSRSFAPAHVATLNGGENPSNVCEGLATLQEDEVFFDSPAIEQNIVAAGTNTISPANNSGIGSRNTTMSGAKIIEHQRQLYIGERVHGWRTSAIIGMHTATVNASNTPQQQHVSAAAQQQSTNNQQQHQQQPQQRNSIRGNRISSQILDGVLENSRRPLPHRVKLFSINDLDDRNDHRPFFTYWINTVQVLVLFLSLFCYGIGPIGVGVEQKTGQVLVTSLSLQTVQHQEQRNVWIGPRNNDLVHMGAKFATCMRPDVKIIDVLLKTRRQERETACCIRNDDSGCVQSLQADCSVRGLFPTKSISTWKKWSPGESGPGGRISGSVCGLDPKYCDAPASIAPYEWPDDITKWPICRKTNSFSQRFRYKDHTAEHMVCEVIGHPCCTGVFGECRITTREYCDFVNGYFHEEASLCSQISCLNNVCGMFPFFSIEVPDQFYRLFTSLCLHAGILHLAITLIFQHVYLTDLERLIGPLRTAIVYIGSGLAGNLTSAVLVPYKPEVGPLASLSGVVASLVVLLILTHWKQLHKPHIALFKLIFIGGLLFAVGTLPWQLNFAGLLAGIFCGIFLTIALVPFVSVNNYVRKSKINFIWSCIIVHIVVYTVLLIIFYLFPTELTNLNFGEVLSGSFNTKTSETGSAAGIENYSNNVMTSSSNKNHQQQQYHHHHHSDDIIGNNALNSGNSASAHFLQSQSQIYFSHNYYNSRINGNIKSASQKKSYQSPNNRTSYFMHNTNDMFNNKNASIKSKMLTNNDFSNNDVLGSNNYNLNSKNYHITNNIIINNNNNNNNNNHNKNTLRFLNRKSDIDYPSSYANNKTKIDMTASTLVVNPINNINISNRIQTNTISIMNSKHDSKSVEIKNHADESIHPFTAAIRGQPLLSLMISDTDNRMLAPTAELKKNQNIRNNTQSNK